MDSVTCDIKIKSSDSKAMTSTAQLYSGSTAKGSSTTGLGAYATETVVSLTPGTWTRSELSDCRLYLYFKPGGGKLDIYFYGADLTVTYTYNSEKFMLKIGGTWADVSRVLKKVDGIWVEQTELSSAVDTDKRLVNGGQIINYVPVTILGTVPSDSTDYCYVIINGTKYTSPTEVVVGSGEKITFGVYGTTSVAGYVRIDGTDVLTVKDSTTQEYTWKVPGGLSSIEIQLYYMWSPIYGQITVTTTKTTTT